MDVPFEWRLLFSHGSPVTAADTERGSQFVPPKHEAQMSTNLPIKAIQTPQRSNNSLFGVHALAGGVSSTVAAAITCPLEVGQLFETVGLNDE